MNLEVSAKMNQAERFWDKLSMFYDKETKRFDWLNAKVLSNTNRYLKGSDKLLDCGCGTGTMTIQMAKYVNQLYAFDISSNMIEIAKEKANKHDIININFLKTDINNDQYGRESFDIITVFNLLHLLEDRQKVYKRINELLKAKGFFISVTPCSGEKKTSINTIFESIKMLYFLFTKVKMVPIRTFSKVSGFKKQELEKSISSEYFQIIDAEYLNGTEKHYFIVAQKK